MPNSTSSRVVRLTPPGRGAIASLRIESPDVVGLLAPLFCPAGARPLSAYALDRIVFGTFRLGSHPGEEVVVSRRTPEAVELHCHGGRAAVARIEEALAERGCPAVSWQAWVAERHGHSIVVAARIALAAARTARTAAILLDQHNGALGRAATEIDRWLCAGEAARAAEGLALLLSRAGVGRHLVEPWRVVLAGPPNVGKSSLINALVGYARAIVDPRAGTTRDVVSAATAIEGWPVALSDTAGLRESGRALERAGIELARRRVASADLLLLVFDLSRPWSSEQHALVEAHPRALIVLNKCDLPPRPDSRRPDGPVVSALTGQGLDRLTAAIARHLVGDPPPPGAAVPFTPDQIEALEVAAAAVARGDLEAARGSVRRLSNR